jgi:aromatic-L-amino-acid decarboxylase
MRQLVLMMSKGNSKLNSISKVSTPLNLNGSDFQSIMVEIVSFLSKYLDRDQHALMFDRSNMSAYLDNDAVRKFPSEDGRPLGDLLDLIAQAANSDVDTSGATAFMAIPGSGLASAAAADLISGILNRFTALGAVAPGLVALEENVLQWMRALMGLPSTGGGILTSGASMATLSAMVCARTERLPGDFRKGVIYATNQTHSSLAKALRLIGFSDDALRIVDADDSLRMDIESLRSSINHDRAEGRQPFCVVGNAGTTDTGTIDPLESLSSIARDEGLWFHVDAAYGGFFQLTDRGRAQLKGIELADSVVLDPHKGLFVPFGTGGLLVRDASVLRRAHSGVLPSAVSDLDDIAVPGARLPDFAASSPELTRPNRGLRLWLPLQLHGVAAFRRELDQKLDLAERTSAALSKIPQINVLQASGLSVVAFHCRIPGGTRKDEDHATKKLVEYLNATRHFRLSTVRIHGRIIARIAILSIRTSEMHLTEAINTIHHYLNVKFKESRHASTPSKL